MCCSPRVPRCRMVRLVPFPGFGLPMDVVLFTIRSVSKVLSGTDAPCCTESSRVATGEPPTGKPRPATTGACRPPRPRFPRPLPQFRIGIHSSAMLLQAVLPRASRPYVGAAATDVAEQCAAECEREREE